MGTTVFLLEPEVTPPPRRCALRMRSRLLLACASFVFLAVIFGGLMAVLESGRTIWLAIAGKDYTAHVLRIEPIVSPGTNVGARRYLLTYRFDRELPKRSLPRTVTIRVSVPPPPRPIIIEKANVPPVTPPPPFKVGEALQFRYGSIGKWSSICSWPKVPVGRIVSFMAVGGILIAVGIIFLLRLARWQKQRMHLLRHGLAVKGSIVNKNVDSLEGKYYLTYSYLPKPDARLCERNEACTPNQWKLFQVGDRVTILCDPDRKDSAGLYRLLLDM